MLNRFGQFVRKLRIEHGQLLKDMADALKVSPAFLSAVECGKKSIPSAWCGVIAEQYGLKDSERAALAQAFDESQRMVTLNLEGEQPGRRAVAVAFSRDFNSLSDQQLELVRKALITVKHGE